MDPQAILDLYDQEMRLDPPGGRVQVYRHPGLTYVTAPPPSPHGGWVLYTHLTENTIEAAIAATMEFFRGHGEEFEWKVYDHDTPADLRERLQAHGFVSEEEEGLLALDLETVPPEFWQTPEVEIRRIITPDQLADVARVQAEVWGEDFDGLADWLSAELSAAPDELCIYAAYVEGQPASSAWIRFYPQRTFAELYGGSTIERFRGRGIYRALVAARAQEARQRGVRFLAVDTSPMSRPILQRLGFAFLTHTQPFVWRAERAPE